MLNGWAVWFESFQFETIYTTAYNSLISAFSDCSAWSMFPLSKCYFVKSSKLQTCLATDNGITIVYVYC